MEHGNSSKQQDSHATRAPASGIVIEEPTETNNVQANAEKLNDLTQQSVQHVKDHYMHLTKVTRIMRSVLPANAKITKDAKEMMQECVSEFISFITNEANQRCNQESRKIIGSEHIISAMGTLGFNDYIEPLTLFLNKHRSQDPNRNNLHQVTFARHRANSVRQPEALEAQLPPPTMGHAPTLPSVSMVTSINYFGLPQTSDYYMGNPRGDENGGEGSSRNLEFDQFKQ